MLSRLHLGQKSGRSRNTVRSNSRSRVFAPQMGHRSHFSSVMFITAAVVLLSIVSLSMIIAAGAKDRRCRSYGICAGIALGMMLVGALGIKLVPAAYFGVVERFSVFAATGFNTVLGIHLFCTRPENERPQGRI